MGTGAQARRMTPAYLILLVFLNGQGPFRMLVDTGAASSLVRPEVALKIGLQPTYAVEQVTAAGNRLVPAGILAEVRVGAVADQAVEAMIGPVRAKGVDGVLGQSFLVRHDYLLDYHDRRVVLDGPPRRASGGPCAAPTGGR